MRARQTGFSNVVVMRASNGLQRRTVASNAGWPAFGPDGRLFFHRFAPDGWCPPRMGARNARCLCLLCCEGGCTHSGTARRHGACVPCY